MSKDTPTLNIPLRPLQPPGPDSLDLSSKAIKAWLDGLPMAHSGEAGRRLFDALRQVNGTEADPAQRFEFLEALRQPVSDIVSALDKHYIGVPFPLPATNRRVADLAMAFFREMAIGFTQVLADLSQLRGITALTRRSMLNQAAYQALRCRSKVLLKAFQVYSPYPRSLWREMHELYSFAQRSGIATKPIEDSNSRLVKTRSIEDIYKQVLLLALSNPYRLRQGDVVKVSEALELWTRYCQLTPVGRSDDSPQGLFAIRQDSDEQPRYLDGSRPAKGLTWVLDTTRLGGLLRELDAHLKGQDAEPPNRALKALPPDLPQPLLQRIMLSWGMMVVRGHSRYQSAEVDKIDIALGLSAVYHFSGGDGSLLQNNKHGGSHLLDLPLSDWQQGRHGAAQRDHRTYCCKVLDESNGGYRLAWCSEEDLRVQVGELLGIHLPGQPETRWRIAVVRWMRAQGEKDMEIGVQTLANAVKPQVAQACNAEGQCGDYQACLLLPPHPASDQGPSLVAPSFFHTMATRVMLTDGRRKQVVELSKTVEDSGAFAQFEFVQVTHAPPQPPTPDSAPASPPAPAGPPPETPPPSKVESEFESIWKDL